MQAYGNFYEFFREGVAGVGAWCFVGLRWFLGDFRSLFFFISNGSLGGGRAFRATPQSKTGRPPPGSSSQGRSAGPGPAAVLSFAG
jgi:hypothetical protein